MKQKQEISSAEEFRSWLEKDAEDKELFEKVDWNYYEKKGDQWIKEFSNWNKLRRDRIGVLEKWLKEME